MALIDTNIFVRLFTSDEEQLLARSVELIERIEGGEEKGVISVLVLNELIWVLEQFYGFKKTDYVPDILELLSIKNMKILETKKKYVVDALKLMLTKNLDFTDCYLLQVKGDHELFTFDKPLLKASKG